VLVRALEVVRELLAAARVPVRVAALDLAAVQDQAAVQVVALGPQITDVPLDRAMFRGTVNSRCSRRLLAFWALV